MRNQKNIKVVLMQIKRKSTNREIRLIKSPHPVRNSLWVFSPEQKDEDVS